MTEHLHVFLNYTIKNHLFKGYRIYLGRFSRSSLNAALFRRLACRPAAFCAVWGGQPKGETPLADHKLHAARVRVCVGLAALAGVGCGISGQPVLEVGVVCADIS